MQKQTSIRLFLILVAAFVLFIMISYYKSRSSRQEQFESAPAPAQFQAAPAPVAASSSAHAAAAAVVPSEPLSNEQYRPVEYATGPKTVKNCFPKDRLTTEDLLPKDAANSKWAQANPAGQGDVKDQNFLTAGFLVGVNTVGQTLRNANLQLRSEPPNPQYKVSPWNQTTIEPDINRRPLEVGADC